MSNEEHVNYQDSNGRLRVNFSLVFLDLGLVQYPHGIVKEQVYVKALSKIYTRFLDNNKKEANFQT